MPDTARGVTRGVEIAAQRRYLSPNRLVDVLVRYLRR